MEQQENRILATQVAVGWVLFFLIKVFALSTSILFSIYENNGFQSLMGDPGPEAAGVLLYVFWVASMVPIYVFVVSRFRSTLWRWPVFLLGSALFLLGVLHHWNHFSAGERVGFTSNVIDFMAHGAALWMVYSSFVWARHRESA
jgi:hypothetical protein